MAKWLVVKCSDCENEQTLFARAAQAVTCTVCGATLATPTGGMADIRGEVVNTLA